MNASDTPAASSAFPNASSFSVVLSQFWRSQSPSKGDADACTPLSPVFGADASPKPSQPEKRAPRSDSGGAMDGSVGPTMLPRKSVHRSADGANRTTK